jgi:heat shock protein HslJ
MRPFTQVIAAAASMLALSSLHMSAGQMKTADLNGTWELIEVHSRPVQPAAASARPSFTIKDQSIEGFDGCNTFSGRLDKPGSIVSTRRGCAEDIVKLPLDLADPLSHLESGKVHGDTLTLPARNGLAHSVFRRRTSKQQ